MRRTETRAGMWAAIIAVTLATAPVSVAAAKDAAPVLSVSHDAAAPYRTVQAAIDALPATGGTIRIAPGQYREKIHVTRAAVRLVGTGRRPNDVVLVNGDASLTVGGTVKSATLTASGDGFRATNLTIQNDYWLDPAHPPSQAVALALTADRAVLRRVRLLGHQDTLYANRGPGRRPARQYFRDCYIEGHVDFVFGDANAYFDRCRLHGLPAEAVMFTAQSRLTADDDSAYVFDRCRFTADPRAGEVSLGRAWRPYARVVLLDARIDAAVIPAGWREWTPGKTDTLSTAWYAEYRSTGAGANPAAREPRSHQLTAEQARAWRLASFFRGDPGWLKE